MHVDDALLLYDAKRLNSVPREGSPQPLQVGQAAQAEDAFRYFRGGNNTGKTVLDFREDGQTSVSLDPGDCYTSRVSTKSVGLARLSS